MRTVADNRIELGGEHAATGAVTVSRTEVGERVATLGALLIQYGLSWS